MKSCIDAIKPAPSLMNNSERTINWIKMIHKNKDTNKIIGVVHNKNGFALAEGTNNAIENSHNSSVINIYSILFNICCWLTIKEVENKINLLVIKPKIVPRVDIVNPSKKTNLTNCSLVAPCTLIKASS